MTGICTILLIFSIGQSTPAASATATKAGAPHGGTAIPPVASAAAPSGATTVDAFFTFYAANLRGSLFTGFLTLAGFLLSAKTFIIVNMKKEVYEHDQYKKRITDIKKLNSAAKYYAPLQNLSCLLFFTVLFCLVASVSQLTLGLYPAWWAATTCLLLAINAVVFLLLALWQIRANLNQLFNFLEEQEGNG